MSRKIDMFDFVLASAMLGNMAFTVANREIFPAVVSGAAMGGCLCNIARVLLSSPTETQP